PPESGAGPRRRDAFRTTANLGREDRHDLECDRVDDHKFFLEDEELEAAESRDDVDDFGRNHEEVEAPRNHGSHADCEIHVADAEPRREALIEHDIMNARALL